MAIQRKAIVIDSIHNTIRNLVARHLDVARADPARRRNDPFFINADSIFSEARALTGSVDEAGRVMRTLYSLLNDDEKAEVFAAGRYDGNNIVIYQEGCRPDFPKPVINKLSDGQMAKLAIGIYYGLNPKPNTIFAGFRNNGFKVTRANISSAESLVETMRKSQLKLGIVSMSESGIEYLSDEMAKNFVKRLLDDANKPKKKVPKKLKLNGSYTVADLKKMIKAS